VVAEQILDKAGSTAEPCQGEDEADRHESAEGEKQPGPQPGAEGPQGAEADDDGGVLPAHQRRPSSKTRQSGSPGQAEEHAARGPHGDQVDARESDPISLGGRQEQACRCRHTGDAPPMAPTEDEERGGHGQGGRRSQRSASQQRRQTQAQEQREGGDGQWWASGVDLAVQGAALGHARSDVEVNVLVGPGGMEAEAVVGQEGAARDQENREAQGIGERLADLGGRRHFTRPADRSSRCPCSWSYLGHAFRSTTRGAVSSRPRSSNVARGRPGRQPRILVLEFALYGGSAEGGVSQARWGRKRWWSFVW